MWHSGQGAGEGYALARQRVSSGSLWDMLAYPKLDFRSRCDAERLRSSAGGGWDSRGHQLPRFEFPVSEESA